MTQLTREPRLSDVAQRAGVSTTTVSRVLNNRGYLSQNTRDRVARAIDELQYRPNEVARALLGQRTHMVGVILPTVSLPFFGELAVAIEHALGERGYRTLLCNSLGRVDSERGYLLQLEGNRVDGIISGAHNDTLPEYGTTRLPVVTIDREVADHIPNVRADNFTGGRLATELLLRRGARRPALLTSRGGPHNLREAGYRAALKQAGIEPTVRAVRFGTPEPERTRLIGAALEELSGSIDGVFATDDLTACTVIDWARRHGLRVPEDLRVVGFDGTNAIRTAVPWLTTVQQPIQQIADAAVAALLKQIDAGPQGGRRAPTATIELPVRLIEGATTASTPPA
ncbi:MAG: LacI family DNA-binding transcriptional regulator [Propioniciclava sp.]|uniref:LacI family DNA-binding transcriptional regulator n=1 Tax=Propioniciclava sp. TaxID=2038686 RepID=UPI0039E21F2A